MSSQTVRSNLMALPAVAWLVLFMVVPCLIILAYAFLTRGLYGGIEYMLTAENFQRVIDPLYAKIFLTSVRIAGLATLLAILIAYPAAYAICLAPKRTQPLLLFFAVLPFWSELSNPHLCLDRAPQPRRPDQQSAALVWL